MVSLSSGETSRIFGACRDEVGRFLTDVLDVRRAYYWSKMGDIESAIDSYDRVSVRAGHGVSKTYTLARVALKFLYTRVPSTVVTTAPTGHQVKDLLWRELRTAHSKAKIPLGGKLTTMMLDMQVETDLIWFATGFATKPDTVTREATAFQGYHNDNLLIALDEAAGILPEIWRATEHIGAPYKRVVAIGNPTSRVGDFAETFKDPSWHNLSISVKDTPNYKAGRTIIPGIYGREYESRIVEKYGRDSDEYRVRVLGEVSNKAELGSYYGSVIRSLRDAGMVCHPEIRFDPCARVFTVWDPGYTTAIWWFQRGPQGARFIDYYEDSDQGVEDYALILKRKAQAGGWNYGGHYAPADIDNNAQRVTVGKTVLELGRELGLNFTPLQRERSVTEGIDRTRSFLKRASFAPACSRGVDLLEAYHERVNRRFSTEDNLVFTGTPEKDGTDHCADAMRYASMAYGRLPGYEEVGDVDTAYLAGMYRGAYA